jgi:hypothetical protein
MNHLTFAKRNCPYEIDGQPYSHIQMEYVVDGVDLSVRLGFATLDALSMSTRLTVDELNKYRALALCGLAEPDNQLDSGRLVLYGCHCGCDYDGVISCMVKREDDRVIWSDIRGEEFCEEVPTPIAELVFSAEQVDSVLESLKDDAL